MRRVIESLRTGRTHSVKKIDKLLGFAPLKAPSNGNVGGTTQEGPDCCKTFIRGNFQ